MKTYTIEEVIKLCDCWTERALRVGGQSSFHARAHDGRCPYRKQLLNDANDDTTEDGEHT